MSPGQAQQPLPTAPSTVGVPPHERPTGELMNIGDALALLVADFPDLTITKIRYLESEGLVEPSRTPAGYRKYSVDDVERLRFVLTAQRDHYMPLKVIKARLEARDAGEPTADVPDRLDREQMLATTGLSPAALATLDDSGLLARRRGGYYSADDVAVALLVDRLSAFGLEPRHLRAFKGAADREAGLIEQAVFPSGAAGTSDARQHARRHANDLTELCLALHAALLRAGVRRDLGL
ncbi:MAG: transcriptional regulator FtsR [Sporichthyaceae bacterium]